ncbi:DNA-3-methyladenine glycosylase [Rhizobium sp. BK251]|uniref:DNA-3-methyladenine glycosylase family protein n=1 Tax=Rhizobium sp. BK251 TaxID=2512125 RepID=UPI00104CB33D|nr:DNA-3-methyladenine glycosylase [Rhizobium sp. BK251]TCL72639.1 DNA-3-methyladenine glycosylase II [Rhizobium sp. BK251]
MRIIRNEMDIEEGLEALVGLDPRLRQIVSEAGPVPLRLAEPGFAGLAHIVVSQMVSRASAGAIWGRMQGQGEALTAEAYAALHSEAWREFGLSRGKADTLSRVALAVASGSLDLQSLLLKPPEEARAALTAIKGIGPWTAEVYLMFCGGHADIFPAGDVALQNAVGAGLGLEARPEPKVLSVLAEGWSPWRSVAARLFWAYYAAKLRRDVLPIG